MTTAPPCAACPYTRPRPAYPNRKRLRPDAAKRLRLAVRSLVANGYDSGGNLSALALFYGVSRQRVHQVAVAERRRDRDLDTLPEWLRTGG